MSELAEMILDQADQLLQHMAKDSSLNALTLWLNGKDFEPEIEAMILKQALFKSFNKE